MMKFLEDLWKKLLVLSRINPSTEGPRCAMVGRKFITTCTICPYAIVRKNVWSKNYPTHQCGMMGDKFIYTPNLIPRWCPYATT